MNLLNSSLKKIHNMVLNQEFHLGILNQENRYLFIVKTNVQDKTG